MKYLWHCWDFSGPPLSHSALPERFGARGIVPPFPSVVTPRIGTDNNRWRLQILESSLIQEHKPELNANIHRSLYAFLTCNRASCLTHDVKRHHHRRVFSWVMRLRLLRATMSLPKQPFAFFFFTELFSWVTNKNLQHDHCRSICNALMMITGVIETFTICRWFRFHWPWFS